MVAFFFPPLFNGAFRSVDLVHTSSSASETAQYGDDSPGRWIAVIAVSGDTVASAYNLSATISGAGATIIVRHNTGDPGVPIGAGSGIFVGQPSGTSGTVTISSSFGNPNRRFFVLRVMGYDLSAAIFSDDSGGAGVPPWSANVPAGGLTLSVVNNRDTLGAISWTGLTERIPDSSLLTGKLVSAAWDVDMAVNPAKAVDVTASDTNGLTSALIATFALA